MSIHRQESVKDQSTPTWQGVTGDRQHIIRLNDVGHVFQFGRESVHALEDCSLEIAKGEFLAIVGPSGCGKSTILNLIVGLIKASRGEVVYDGKPVTGINTRVGYVTQRDNLFPWRTLQRNVEFGMEMRGYDVSRRRRIASQLIHDVGLSGFESRYPHQLSGGMRQRANIVRTLAYSPEVILMDEPFGPLDAQTRLVLQDQLLTLWQERVGTTVVFITHDLSEAIALADRVAVMTQRPGHVLRTFDIGLERPRDVFRLQGIPEFHDIYTRIWKLLEEEMRPEQRAR